MTQEQQKHFQIMLDKNRLLPFVFNGILKGFITFYITNNEQPYVEAYPYKVMGDDSEGNICYITQMRTNKDTDNSRLSFKAWTRFKIHISNNFPNVKVIKWRRWDKKNKIVKIYKKELQYV